MNDGVEGCIGMDPDRDDSDDLGCTGADMGVESKDVALKDEDGMGLAPRGPRLCLPIVPLEELVRIVDSFGDEGKDCVEVCIEVCTCNAGAAGGGDTVGEKPGDCIAGVWTDNGFRTR